ncbi:group-specific protein [Fictibacillus macauensis ZFHKF-1]|uniref:Group-specific protein n=1 Tax=Fictibacillus macauensis ZFHKF-1 TaxID=1196324 RepID=I8UJL6_9BACL|nr:nucleoside 2-deoxyribosyltransferase [Fictibacillus macauensis]EIT87070.1 group-specific protein [Fictibacillus macauensis ZFHKF-1]
MPSFYIASGFQNKALVQQLKAQLEAHGFEHTYDWTVNERATTADALRAIGEAELQGVKQADFLVVLLPGGNGTHVELGIALAEGKTVYLYEADEASFHEKLTTFYYIQNVHIIHGTFTDLVHKIIQN